MPLVGNVTRAGHLLWPACPRTRLCARPHTQSFSQTPPLGVPLPCTAQALPELPERLGSDSPGPPRSSPRLLPWNHPWSKSVKTTSSHCWCTAWLHDGREQASVDRLLQPQAVAPRQEDPQGPPPWSTDQLKAVRATGRGSG